MDEKDFESLLESVQWMKDDLAGKKPKGGRTTKVQLAIDVKKVRAATRLSQEKFARVVNVPVGTLRGWEQGRRQPEGAALSLLRAIKNDPVNVIRAINS